MAKVVNVRVTAGARKELVEEVEPGFLKVKVAEPPEKGRANDRVVELLAEYFGISESIVSLKHGRASKDKTFIIG